MTTRPLNHIITNESITVVYEGKSHVVKSGAPQFINLRKAIIENRWEDVPGHLTVTKSIETWSNDKFVIKDNQVTYLGQEIPRDINDRIVTMATNGEDPTILFNFWERLSKNPSYRSVNQLYTFLKHANIPLTPEGKILTYKSVRQDYKDVHSGQFDNKPGTTNQMPRNQISDDPQKACHEGFHVGAMGYVSRFHSGGRIVVCEVDPEDVVCVPYDSHSEKMRVCKYVVIGNYGSELPSTSVSIKDLGYHAPTSTEPDDEEEEMEIEENEWTGDADDDDDSGEEDEQGEEEDTEEGEDEDEDAGEEEVEGGVKSKDLEYERSTSSKEEQKKHPAPTPKKPAQVKKKVPNKGYAKFNKMDTAGLIKQSLDDLRKYATYGLEIVGASKIPGGKVALISRILEIRGDGSDD